MDPYCQIGGDKTPIQAVQAVRLLNQIQVTGARAGNIGRWRLSGEQEQRLTYDGLECTDTTCLSLSSTAGYPTPSCLALRLNIRSSNDQDYVYRRMRAGELPGTH